MKRWEEIVGALLGMLVLATLVLIPSVTIPPQEPLPVLQAVHTPVVTIAHPPTHAPTVTRLPPTPTSTRPSREPKVVYQENTGGTVTIWAASVVNPASRRALATIDAARYVGIRSGDEASSTPEPFIPRTWSPDGAWLAVQKFPEPNNTLLLVNYDGTQIQRITTTGSIESIGWLW